MQGTLFPDLLAGPRSGKHGAVVRDGGAIIEQVKFWTFNQTNAPEDLVHSASKGGHNRIAGFDDFNVSFEGFGGFPNFFPGNHVNFHMFAGPDDGILGHVGKVLIAPVRISSLTINWNWTPNGSLEWVAAGESNGCLLEPTDNSYVDTSEICSPQMCSLSMYMGECDVDEEDYSEVLHLQSASLTITADNPSYTSSSTNCCTGREEGNLDWSLDLIDLEANRTFAYRQYFGFKMYISDSQYWIFRYGLNTGVTNWTVNRQTGVIKSKTNNFMSSGQVCCPSFTDGVILAPNGNQMWPVEPVAPL